MAGIEFSAALQQRADGLLDAVGPGHVGAPAGRAGLLPMAPPRALPGHLPVEVQQQGGRVAPAVPERIGRGVGGIVQHAGQRKIREREVHVVRLACAVLRADGVAGQVQADVRGEVALRRGGADQEIPQVNAHPDELDLLPVGPVEILG